MVQLQSIRDRMQESFHGKQDTGIAGLFLATCPHKPIVTSTLPAHLPSVQNHVGSKTKSKNHKLRDVENIPFPTLPYNWRYGDLLCYV